MLVPVCEGTTTQAVQDRTLVDRMLLLYITSLTDSMSDEFELIARGLELLVQTDNEAVERLAQANLVNM